MTEQIAAIAKSLTAALAAAAGALSSAAVDDQITTGEALAALIAALVGGFAVWRIPNRAE